MKKIYVYRIGLLGLDYFFVNLIPNQNPDFFKNGEPNWIPQKTVPVGQSGLNIFFFYNPSF